MLFSYNWLKNYVLQTPKPEKLAEILTMHSFEVESVAKKGKDCILNIDVLPNRAHDCFCHWGIAREIVAITRGNLKPLSREKLKTTKGKIKPINLKIECKKLVPRYSAVVVEGVTISSSPKWLREKLEAVGVRPINNIVDLTNFVMLETSQPLHAFDYDRILDKRMVLRQAKKGEKVITLDDIERKLDKGILVIEDKNRLIDLVGIMGGKLSEVGPKTKNIILQAGNFDRKSIYKTAKSLKHETLASNIYSQGIDPNLTISALERAYFLLRKLSGGKTVQIIDIYPKKVLPKKVKLDSEYIEKLLGAKIPLKTAIDILKRLEFKITKSSKNSILVQVPTFRTDIEIPEDLIEEIGRIFGYEKIQASFPLVSLIPPKKNFEIFWENIAKDVLKESGFFEVYNYSFLGEDVEIFGFKKEKLIELENPVSAEQKYLRPSLIPNLIKNVKSNSKFFEEIKIFELGKIFYTKQKIGNTKQIIEKRNLTGIITGDSFYQLKGVVDILFSKLGIAGVWYDEYKPSPEQSKKIIWQPQKCAEIKINQEEIGFLGAVSHKVLKELKINDEICVFDIDFEKLIKVCTEECQYRPVSSFPAAIRDIALLVPREVRVEEVLNKIETAGGSLVCDIDLFDIYEGEELPEGKKNLAFHIVYQAEDRTLKSSEIDKIQEKIIKFLEENPEWEVRR